MAGTLSPGCRRRPPQFHPSQYLPPHAFPHETEVGGPARRRRVQYFRREREPGAEAAWAADPARPALSTLCAAPGNNYPVMSTSWRRPGRPWALAGVRLACQQPLPFPYRKAVTDLDAKRRCGNHQADGSAFKDGAARAPLRRANMVFFSWKLFPVLSTARHRQAKRKTHVSSEGDHDPDGVTHLLITGAPEFSEESAPLWR